VGCASAAGRAGTPCERGGACAAGTSCVVGRCRPAGAAPASGDSARQVVAPDELAVLSAHGPEDASPDAIAFGQAARGSTVLLLRYAPRWADGAEVEAAFLVLEPLAGAPSVQLPVRVELARVLEPWSAASATWARQPRLGLPAPAATLRPAPPGPLRLEVTEIVRGWAKRPRGEHGIAVVASGEDPFGAVFTSGRSDGQAPRLEVYLR
jgi:hypothetical protein